jgi:hypothetical protein
MFQKAVFHLTSTLMPSKGKLRGKRAHYEAPVHALNDNCRVLALLHRAQHMQRVAVVWGGGLLQGSEPGMNLVHQRSTAHA